MAVGPSYRVTAVRPSTRASQLVGFDSSSSVGRCSGLCHAGFDRVEPGLALDCVDERLTDLVLLHLELEPEQPLDHGGCAARVAPGLEHVGHAGLAVDELRARAGSSPRCRAPRAGTSAPEPWPASRAARARRTVRPCRPRRSGFGPDASRRPRARPRRAVASDPARTPPISSPTSPRKYSRNHGTPVNCARWVSSCNAIQSRKSLRSEREPLLEPEHVRADVVDRVLRDRERRILGDEQVVLPEHPLGHVAEEEAQLRAGDAPAYGSNGARGHPGADPLAERREQAPHRPDVRADPAAAVEHRRDCRRRRPQPGELGDRGFGPERHGLEVALQRHSEVRGGDRLAAGDAARDPLGETPVDGLRSGAHRCWGRGRHRSGLPLRMLQPVDALVVLRPAA